VLKLKLTFIDRADVDDSPFGGCLFFSKFFFNCKNL